MAANSRRKRARLTVEERDTFLEAADRMIALFASIAATDDSDRTDLATLAGSTKGET